MEHWLDDHLHFVKDYFSRKATRSMIEGWLTSHTRSQLRIENESDGGGAAAVATAAAAAQLAPPTSSAPIRKISSSIFEKGGLLQPMISNVDGSPTFLNDDALPPPPPPRAASGSGGGGGAADEQQQHLRRASELKGLAANELVWELAKDIFNDLDIDRLCHKILQHVCMLLNADRCSLFLVQGARSAGGRKLVNRLFDVHSGSDVKDCRRLHNADLLHIPWGKGIAGYVAEHGLPVVVADAYEDPRFNSSVDEQTGYHTKSMICLPIKDASGDILGVAQAINKSCSRGLFDDSDMQVFESYLAFCGIGIKNAQQYEKSRLENRRNQVMLDLVRIVFEEQKDATNLVYKIMSHTQSLLQCERCQVLLLDRHLKTVFSQVYNYDSSDMAPTQKQRQQEHLPMNTGITSYVVATCQTVNIADAYHDSRFDPSSDYEWNFRTKSILCVPICSANHKQVIGAFQLINKLDGSSFTTNDEQIFEAFAIFCGIGIDNALMYEQTCQAVARQSVALEVLAYHAVAPEEEATKLKSEVVLSSQHYRLLDFGFDDVLLEDCDTVKACIRMFIDLDLIDRFHIQYEVLCRWLLSIKKNYRNITYHNWRHAFNVAQSMFVMLKCMSVERALGDLERLALLVACICHDLDHRGTNNQFQQKTMSPLSRLYSTSVMEHHHFDHSIMLLNAKGNQIFSNLRQEDYEKVISIMESAILATDLAEYFRKRDSFFHLVQSGECRWSNQENKNLLMAMMMTACDLSAITKPWHIQRRVAFMVADEFFQQGDLEKEQLKIKPVEMMDRDKKDRLPSLQVSFIDTICLPVYEAFSRLYPDLGPLLDGCRQNKQNWLQLSEKKDSLLWH